MSTETRQLDTTELEQRVKRMYEEVALEPDHEFHFETGRALAERLGYPTDELDRIPAAAIESFAGVGYFLDLAAIEPGEAVLDLGSGSGTDSFLAALRRPDGRVIGIDMTDAQLAKAGRLAREDGFDNVEFRARLHRAPAGRRRDAFDCVISNGVINLSPDKPAVFAAAAARAAAGRAPRARRHRHRQAAARGRDLRRLAVGRLHRRRDAARRLPRRRSRPPASRSRPGARTPDTASSPSAPTTRRQKYGVTSVSLLAAQPIEEGSRWLTTDGSWWVAPTARTSPTPWRPRI